MYLRLLAVGARGQYLPDLVVHHYVHPERLTRRYYRSWCFWNGASKGVLGRRHALRVRQLAGVPRYAFGDAVRGLLGWIGAVARGGPRSARMAGELPAWHLAGRIYGRYLQRDDLRRQAGSRPGSEHDTTCDPAQEPASYGDGSSVIEPTSR